MRAREDDILTNLPLQARLRDDFGLSLPELDVDEEWTPSTYFAQTRDAVLGKPRWNIDDHGMQLGFFSFAKQLMQRDLQQHEWPNGRLGDDVAIGKLMAFGFETEPSLFGPNEPLDGRLAPEDIVQVIDADAPQTKVIEEVRSGHNLVVQGPPGTGKSQTITNIIAAAVHDGKTVLFMAEKMAALDVVHARMKKCELGDLCLELHSRHANKREVLRELGRTLNARVDGESQSITAAELRVKRDELNSISDMLHREVANRGFTTFEAIAAVVGFISSGRNPPTLSRSGLTELTLDQCEEIESNIGELGNLLKSCSPRQRHPFAGCQELNLTPIQLERLKDGLQQAIEALEAALSETSTFVRESQQESGPDHGDIEGWTSQPESVAEIHRIAAFLDLLANQPAEGMSLALAILGQGISKPLASALEIGAEWAVERRDAATQFREYAWDVPALELQFELERGAARGFKSIFTRLGSDYRRASNKLAQLTCNALPRDPIARVELAKRLANVQRRGRKLKDEEEFLKAHLGTSWRGEQTDFDRLLRAVMWLSHVENTELSLSSRDLVRATEMIADPGRAAETLRALAEAAIERACVIVEMLKLDLSASGIGPALENASLQVLRDRFAAMAENLNRYFEWCRMETLVGALLEFGLDELIGMLDEGTIPPSEAMTEFGYAVQRRGWTWQ